MKEWELSPEELQEIAKKEAMLPKYVGKAYQKSLVEYLKEHGGHFEVDIEGHDGFYELEWNKFEEICKSVGV